MSLPKWRKWGAWLVFVALVAHDPAGGSGPTVASAAETPNVRAHLEILRDIRRVLRDESQAKSLVEKTPAIYELCALHREVTTHPQFVSNEAYQELRRQIASRLVRIQADLKQQLYRRKVEARPDSPTAKRGESSTREKTQSVPTPSLPEVVELLSDHLGLVGAVQNGPAQLVVDSSDGRAVEGDGASRIATNGTAGTNVPRGGAAGPADYGQDLVDLIQKTIHPDFWDVNGGPGTIVYFSPLRCLVVRATHEVHGDVGGLIRGVRNVNP